MLIIVPYLFVQVHMIYKRAVVVSKTTYLRVRYLSYYNKKYRFLDGTVLIIFSIKLTADSKNCHGRPL